jgi:hypothetical protein
MRQCDGSSLSSSLLTLPPAYFPSFRSRCSIATSAAFTGILPPPSLSPSPASPTTLSTSALSSAVKSSSPPIVKDCTTSTTRRRRTRTVTVEATEAVTEGTTTRMRTREWRRGRSARLCRESCLFSSSYFSLSFRLYIAIESTNQCHLFSASLRFKRKQRATSRMEAKQKPVFSPLFSKAAEKACTTTMVN